MNQGCVFHIQRYSTDDGGGIRTCVFLKGCPLRCGWCHNAEGLAFSPQLAHYPQSCIGCGRCAAVCPRGAVSAGDGVAVVDRSRCVACGACAEACPTGALVTVGRIMTVEEVLATVRRDRIFYGTHGGLTITGGEPMAQAAFTVALAEAAKAEGISVAVETSGFGQAQDFLALLPSCDLFLFDCKASSARHRALTGVSDRVIVENLRAICEGGASVILRCPVVVGGNLDGEFLGKIATLAREYPQIQAVQLMPYHTIGTEKSVTLGGAPQMRFEAPDRETLTRIAEQIERESGTRTFFV